MNDSVKLTLYLLASFEMLDGLSCEDAADALTTQAGATIKNLLEGVYVGAAKLKKKPSEVLLSMIEKPG